LAPLEKDGGAKMIGPGPFPPPPTDDDRPPIIVGDGSIDMYADPYAGGTTATWDDVNGDQMTWVNPGDPTKPIQHFDLTILNGMKTGTHACPDPQTVYTLDTNPKLTLEYTGAKTITISLNAKGDFQAVFVEKAQKDADYPYWIWVDGKIRLKSATFRLKGAASDTVCDFNAKHRASVAVHQSVLPPAEHLKANTNK
jgi:hypothetical protein